MEIYKTTSKQYRLLWQSDAGIYSICHPDQGQDLLCIQSEESGGTDGGTYDHFRRHDLYVRSRNCGYCFRSGGRSVYHGNYSGTERHRQRTGVGAGFHSHGGGAVSVHVVRHSLPGTDEYYCFPGGHVHRQGYGDLHSVSA